MLNYIVLLLFLGKVFSDAISDVCVTDEKDKIAECVLITDCPAMLQLLLQRPITQANVEFLQRGLCGFQGTESKVCCLRDVDTKSTEEITRSPMFQYEATLPGNLEDRSFLSNTDLLPNPDDCGFFIEDRNSFNEGRKTQLDGYPWTVILEYNDEAGRKLNCGGALISKRYVLTAAHCVSPEQNLVGVRLGEFNIGSDPDCEYYVFTQYNCCCTDPIITMGIEEKIVHEEYDLKNPNRHHDIAVIRLAQDVTFSEFTRPVCLPIQDERSKIGRVGDHVAIAGWGINEGSMESTQKLKSKMIIKNNTECNSVYSYTGMNLNDDQFCAVSVEGENSCPLDSGGIVINDNSQIISYLSYYALGVLSIRHPYCTLDEYPIILTKVFNYVPWILSKLRP